MDFIDIAKVLTSKDIIGHGKHGKIYSVSPFWDIKVYHPWVENEADFRYEFDLIDVLYAQGRNVPFPVGLVNAPIFNTSGLKWRRGFMMQHIEGIQGDKITSNLKEKVEFYYHEEIARCREIGFFPVDHNLRNSIYSSAEDKLYLVDFRLWRN